SSISVGSHGITAIYAGDANFTSSTAAAVTEVINRADSTTSAAASLNPAVYGQAVTFTATVSASGSGAGTPTGTVVFIDGSTALGSATLSLVNGQDQASFTTSGLAVGSHNITAVYAGDVKFTSSVSSAITQAINRVGSTTSVAASVNPSVFGQEVVFAATVNVSGP